jgi:bifunctional non-homologous end joining protein LigD
VTKELQEYRKKRDFSRTSEPRGAKEGPGDTPVFVIQKHEAQHLHYDLRIEVGGVLKSWAVPKGPSTDPKQKRLAIATEDHPLDYAGFEGIIPEGEYGAGTVLVWDTGPYRNLRGEKEGDGATMEQSLEEGKVEVWLEGEKLKGGYALIRTKRGWLFFKMDDGEADARHNPVLTAPDSVLTGRSLEEIRDESVE